MADARFEKFTTDLRNTIGDMPASPTREALGHVHRLVMADLQIIEGKEPDGDKRLDHTIEINDAVGVALKAAKTAGMGKNDPGGKFEALLTALYALLGTTKRA